MIKKLFYLWMLWVWAGAAYATVSATVGRSTVNEGQSVELILSATDKKTAAPDFTPLQGNFELAGQSTSQRTSIVNGVLSSHYEIRVNLIPLKTGTLTIPPLTWQGETTEPVSLTVQPASSAVKQEDKADGLLIEAALSASTVYENSELIYTVRLYDRMGIVDGDILPPQLAGAEIQALGNDRAFTAERNGKTYQVIEKQFVIFPKEAGTDLKIKPAAFKGFVFSPRTSGADRNLLDPFGFPGDIIYRGLSSMQQEVFVRAEPMTLTVLPKPPELSGYWWLPARSLTMTEAFSPARQEIQVGAPLTRTIRVEAKGVLGTQLPDIIMPDGPGFKVYPEAPQKSNAYAVNEGLIGIEERSFVIIPLTAGTVEIPPVSLSWFNVTTGQQETARLPSAQFQAFGTPAVVHPPEAIEAPAPTAPVSPYAKENAWLFFLGGLCIGLAGTFLLFFFMMRRTRPKKKHLPDIYPKRE